jgi:hypothetical protein
LFVLLSAGVFQAQSDSTQPDVVAQLNEMLHRSGHSPTPEEVQAAEMLPGVSDPLVARAALPLLAKALAHPDSAMRKFALAMLVGMQSAADAAAAPAAPPAAKPLTSLPLPSGPASYKVEVGRVLTPLIPAIASQLTAEDTESRTLAATVLGGFSAEPPEAAFPPLLAYLRRDDAIGPVGLEVVSALLQLGPVSAETATAISRYLKRPDQTASAKVELVEAIASRPNQSPAINRALLGYLDSDDASLRARVILSLPQLDLTPDVFSDLKAHVQTIATGNQDPLPVINAAKSVTSCWTSIKMTSGCPAY